MGGVQSRAKRAPGLKTGTQRPVGAATALGGYVSFASEPLYCLNKHWSSPNHEKNRVDIAVSKNG